jgi:hypothetical protein
MSAGLPASSYAAGVIGWRSSFAPPHRVQSKRGGDGSMAKKKGGKKKGTKKKAAKKKK